ncbi:acetylornithine deacetylase [Acetobacter sacchari]|uniref:Acetylornithine deacetylase n=1 Tax=Acetobacter sacchari TaxID=2661687 RepID=A0ABS3LX95_9PROT|nr:acetylornithine deacetylase [Acetobacter sacchari]MBO1360524.1 acetylornithine deacetylase [Acetobacter sacchari]
METEHSDRKTAAGTVALLERLVAFPTICRHDNLELIDWLAATLTEAGARVEIVPGDEPGRAGLIASVGPDRPDGLVLSAHSDVVPVEGQSWTTDPFGLTERDGKLFGRGSSDMKGFLACAVTAIRDAAARPSLARPLHLAVSYDEEIGCVGVHSLLRRLQEREFAAAGCVVGEPTGLRIAVAHKGKVAARITCHGQAAHSANPALGRNAILMASRMISEIEAIQADMIANGRQDAMFETPHNTAQVGLISGGVALNIVPDLCTVDFEMRLLPAEASDVWIERLQRHAERVQCEFPGGRIGIEVINAYPGLKAEAGSATGALVLAAAGRNDVVTVGFGTEAGLFQEKLGLDTIICGPGSIDRAHKADEYVTRGELAGCERFLSKLVDALV